MSKLPLIGAICIWIMASNVFAYMPMPRYVESNLLVSEGRVIFSQPSGGLTVLDADTGAIIARLTEFDFEGRLIEQGDLILASGSPSAVLDRATLKTLWSEENRSSRIICGDELLLQELHLFESGPIELRELRTGKIIWKRDYGSADVRAVACDEVYMLDKDGRWISKISLKDGKEIYRITPGGIIKFDEMSRGHLLLGLSENSKSVLRVYDSKSGSLVFRKEMDPGTYAVYALIRGAKVQVGVKPRKDREGAVESVWFDLQGNEGEDTTPWEEADRDVESSTHFINLQADETPMKTDGRRYQVENEAITTERVWIGASDWREILTSNEFGWRAFEPTDGGRIQNIVLDEHRAYVESATFSSIKIEALSRKSGESQWVYAFPVVVGVASMTVPYGMPPRMDEQLESYRECIKELAKTSSMVVLQEDDPTTGDELVAILSAPRPPAENLHIDPEPLTPFSYYWVVLRKAWTAVALGIVLVLASFAPLKWRRLRTWSPAISLAPVVIGGFGLWRWGRAAAEPTILLKGIVIAGGALCLYWCAREFINRRFEVGLVVIVALFLLARPLWFFLKWV